MDHLAAEGTRVLHLQSGRHFSVFRRHPRVTRLSDCGGVERYALVNSIARAPALFEFARSPDSQRHAASPEQQVALVLHWLQANGIRRVWIHSLEGQPVELLGALVEGRYEVRVFVHDHFYICPRVDLLEQGRRPCSDYGYGGRCQTCVVHPFAARFETRMMLTQLPFGAGAVARALLRRRDAAAAKPQPVIPRSTDTNEHLLSGLNERSNSFPAAKRRRVLAQSLSSVSRVVCPSPFLAQTLTASGVEPRVIRTVRMVLPHIEQIKRYAEKPTEGSGPLTFAFHGTLQPRKGIRVFLDAVRLVPDHVPARFLVRGVAASDVPDAPVRVLFAGKYDPGELPEFGPSYDVGVLPHLWYENSPLTLLEHLAAGKPVIASRLGGVVDLIEEGRNGWTFPAGRADALAARIIKVAEDGLPAETQEEHHAQTSKAFFGALDE